MELAVGAVSADAQSQLCSGRESSEFSLKIPAGRLFIDLENFVLRLQSGAFCFTTMNDLHHGWGLIEFLDGFEPCVGQGDFGFNYVQTCGREETVPGNLVYSADVLLKEISKVGMTEGLSGSLDGCGIGKEFSLLRIVLNHPAEKVAQGCLVVACATHGKVEHHA